ncbi:MAG: formimidoylglutamase [Bacteroidales bacterium]|nr:formimidoylglutamase [Bacteroidales bacterium]
MNIQQYFEPISKDTHSYISEDGVTTIGQAIKAYTEVDGFPDLADSSLAIMGVGEDRGAVGNKGCATAMNSIRQYLYALASPIKELKLYDLGNITIGETPNDTYYAVIDVMRQLLEHGITTIVIGGGQDLTYAIYKAYEMVGQVINITAIDPRFDISNTSAITSRSYLNHIVMQQPNYLFNFTTLGYQTYLVGNDHIRLIDELNFDAYRLGILQEDMSRAEPLLRNADVVSIDISAVRQNDAPANAHPSPHGFYGEQLCRMARFAGMSDKVSTLGIFELNPLYDRDGQTAHMTAHALWYFIEGFFGRKEENPYYNQNNFLQFIVQLEKSGLELTFYKSRTSDRWWVEVPCDNEERRQRYQRHLLIPCSYDDYQSAMQNEIPELWYRYYQRMQW